MLGEEQKKQNVRAFEAMVNSAHYFNETIDPLDDTYTLARVTPVTGSWYFFARCRNCGFSSPLFEDLCQGQLGNPFSGAGGFRASCYFCAQEIRVISRAVYPAKWI